MGVMGLGGFCLKLLDVVAWPLLAMGYPLNASILAIETNSTADAQKLVAYWVMFSLISLVEHALGTLLVWLRFWPYVKLVVSISLMIPHFDGAFYVYEHFIRPFLAISSRVITDGFNKRKEQSLNAKIYSNENSPEVLEKLISNQSMCKKAVVEPNHIVAAEVKEKKDVTTVEEPRYIANTVSEMEKISAEEKVDKAGPSVTKGGIEFGSVDNKEIPTTAEESVEVLQERQREWTCALCQVKTKSEHVLISHLKGNGILQHYGVIYAV